MQTANVLSGFLSCRGSLKNLAMGTTRDGSSAVYALSYAALASWGFINNVYSRVRSECAGSEALAALDEAASVRYRLAEASLAEILVGRGIPKRLAKLLPVQARRVFQAWKALLPVIKTAEIAALADLGLPEPARITLSTAEAWKTIPAEVRADIVSARACPRYIAFRPMTALDSRRDPVKLLTDAGAKVEAEAAVVYDACKRYRTALQEAGAVPAVEFFGGVGLGRDAHLPRLFAATPTFSIPKALVPCFFYIDRGSALPPTILAPPRGARCAEFCAAPGNKSLMCASMVSAGGVVLSVELDGRRAGTLAARAHAAGAVVRTENDDDPRLTARRPDAQRPVVIVRKGSCLTVPRPALRGVTHILVDPSCSSSGMRHNLDRTFAEAAAKVTEGTASYAREHALPKKLAEFQLEALLAGLNAPDAQRVVYSTCSHHAEENECVVAAALAKNPNFHLEDALPAWPRRGEACAALEADLAKLCLRAGEDTDSSGIFAALFVRNKK